MFGKNLLCCLPWRFLVYPVADGFSKSDDYSIGDACAVNARKLSCKPIGLRIANMQCHLSSSKRVAYVTSPRSLDKPGNVD